jgi:hypothetical protein
MKTKLFAETFGNSQSNAISVDTKNSAKFPLDTDFSVFYGLGGNDVFSYSFLPERQNIDLAPLLVGGTGSDTYSFPIYSNVVAYIQDAGSSSGDVLTIPGVSFSSPQTSFVELDATHLAIVSTKTIGSTSYEQVYILWDWQSAANQIETFSTADGNFSFEQFRSRVRGDDRYFGNLSLEQFTSAINASSGTSISSAALNTPIIVASIQSTLLEAFSPSIYWHNRANGEFVQWKMSGEAYIESTYFPNAKVSNEWKLAGAGSFNFDITNDLVWRNETTGQNVIWYMGDQGIIQSSYLPTVADQAWKIEATADLQRFAQRSGTIIR